MSLNATIDRPAPRSDGSADGRPALPLDGIRVIDLTQVMLGPCATQTLADLGADVIKIEKPRSGDLSRWAVEPDPESGESPVFWSLNRNKRSIALDLRKPEAQAIVHRLVAEADIIVNNFRPGVMERLDLGYARLSAINPGLIYAAGSGFGMSGPYSHKGGQDVLAQAMTGVMARKADPAHPLSIFATALCDYSAGMHLVQGVLAALIGRQSSGRGQVVEVSLYDSMIAMQMQEAASHLMAGRELNWAAMPLTGVFETRDGALVLVGAFKANPLQDICTALAIEDLSADHPSLEVQRANRDKLQAIFRERFASETTAHWIERLEAQDLLCAPVKSLAEALDDPQTRHNGMVVETEDAAGRPIRLVGSPVHLSEAPFALRHLPPQLGEHTEAVLRESGYDDSEIAALRAAGALG